jgi:hypothetical protein
MVFCLAFADIPSCFTENRHGRDDVNHRFESGPSRSREIVLQQVELGRIPLLCFFRSRSLVLCAFPLADWFHGFGPLTVGDTAGAADRIRPSASGKIRTPPAPAQ